MTKIKVGCAYCRDAGPEHGFLWTDNNGPVVACPVCNAAYDTDRARRKREFEAATTARDRTARAILGDKFIDAVGGCKQISTRPATADEQKALERAAAKIEGEAEPGDEDEEVGLAGMRDYYVSVIRGLKHKDAG